MTPVMECLSWTAHTLTFQNIDEEEEDMMQLRW